ncbi:unnamed protein product [Closterium sp. NIES-53]
MSRPPPVHPLPPQGPAPSNVSHVDPLSLAEPIEVAVDSGAARGVASGGAEPKRAEPGGAEPRVAKSEGAEPEPAEPGGTESWGAEPGGTMSAGGSTGASSRREPLSPPQLHEWFVRRTRLRSGTAGAGGPAAGGIGAGGTGSAGPGGARTGGARSGGTGAAGAGCAAGTRGAGGAGGARAAGPSGAASAGARDPGAGGAGAGGTGGAGAAGPGGACTGGTRAAGAGGAAGAGAGDPGAGCAGPEGDGAVGTDSPLPTPPYSEQTDSLIERRAPDSRPASPVRAVRIGRRVPRPLPPSVIGTHGMALRPSSVPLRIHLSSPPESSLADGTNPQSDLVCVASPTVTRLLASVVTDPSFESTAASALVGELVDFAVVCCLHYAASLVAQSEPNCPPSVGGECAFGTDVLEDRQEDFECLAAAVPHLVAMLLAPKGDPEALHIPTPRSYAEVITGPYSSQWQIAMDAEMAHWKSTGTYVNAVPPPGANIVDGMWIFIMKRPPGSPPVFKAR